MKQTIHVEIGGVSTLARLAIWYYVLKGIVYVVKGTIKYTVVLAVAAVVAVYLAWAFTSSPRPFQLDRLDPYLQPVAAFFRTIQPRPPSPPRATVSDGMQPLPFRDD